MNLVRWLTTKGNFKISFLHSPTLTPITGHIPEQSMPPLSWVSVLVWADCVSQRRDPAGSYQEQRHLLGCSFEVLITSLPGDGGTVKSENHCSLASRPC